MCESVCVLGVKTDEGNNANTACEGGSPSVYGPSQPFSPWSLYLLPLEKQQQAPQYWPENLWQEEYQQVLLGLTTPFCLSTLRLETESEEGRAEGLAGEK